MATIIYTKTTSTELDNAQNDLVESSVRLLLEHENEKASAQGGVCDTLFNVEDSQKYAEVLVKQTEFGTFDAIAEGQGANGLSSKEIARKIVEHIQFMGEFGISANMIEDAGYGIAADARKLIKNFIRSYYRTRDLIAEASLVNGMKSSIEFNGATVDLCCADGKPLFSAQHVYGENEGVQSNLFYTEKKSGEKISAEMVEEYLTKVAVKLRNMKDENGCVLGYEADTILIPSDNPELETAVKKAVFSINSSSGDGQANLHYGKWKVIVLPRWSNPDKDSFIVMSSEANRVLGGNMFFNRVPLTVKSWEDYHTGNRMWNGRCRFGIGFGSYKHIIHFTALNAGEDAGEATAI